MSAGADAEGTNTKQSLQKWWKIFNKNKPVERPTEPSPGRVFGITLQTSLTYASVAISQVGDDGKARIYGHVPVVVAKTGLYLKENGTDTPGVFRVSGSSKRIKELETIFDGPPTYGKELTWDAFSVHDAATIFRRYLNMLPEPVIPYNLYSSFQKALPQPTQKPSQLETDKAIQTFRDLINSLPPASQHIFFYVLDLLGVFARRSEVNLMPASNLATIFQPGLIRHPPSTNHAAAPSDSSDHRKEASGDAVKAAIEADSRQHKESQEVLQFLIENQSAFELELPAHLRKKTGSPRLGSSPKKKPGPIVTQTSAPKTAAADEENDYILAANRSAGLNRHGSDKSVDRRTFRRKKQAEKQRLETTQEQLGAVGVKRNRTLPTNKDGRGVRRPPTSPSTEPANTLVTPTSAATQRSFSGPASAPARALPRPQT